MKKGTKIPYINDSKKLSEAKRDELFDIIKRTGIRLWNRHCENDEIDEYNILNATYMAMNKAINALSKKARLFTFRCSYNT